jgi:hypothetical protein
MINDGGPAFPSEYTLPENQGMTLRDYFAAKALQALVPMDRNINAIKYAESAYALADAMLKARGEQ